MCFRLIKCLPELGTVRDEWCVKLGSLICSVSRGRKKKNLAEVSCDGEEASFFVTSKSYRNILVLAGAEVV